MVRRPLLLAWSLLACAAAGAAAPRAALGQRIAEIQIAPSYLRMRQDAITRISATAYDADGKPVDVPFLWRSSNINVAVVDSQGNVRALAPGTAVVVASVEEAGRRRVGQATVFVMREAFRGSPSTPPGAMPGMPRPMAPVPGFAQPNPQGDQGKTPPPRFPRGYVIANPAEAINCEDPMTNSVNPLRACWDTRPTLLGELHAPSPPGADSCPQGASPVGLLLEVTDSGTVRQALPYARSSCPLFTDRIVAMGLKLAFSPAQRAGRPVSAWVRLNVRERR